MFNFYKKKKQPQLGQPVQVHLVDARNRAKPVPFTLHSSELTGLLMEAIQLAKLVTTEKRDLEAIRNDYLLKSSYLEKQHIEVITLIEKEYTERAKIIDGIFAHAKQLTEAGQYEAADRIIVKMQDMLANNSPFRQAMEMRNQKWLS